jgi:hypothetical protein
MQLPIVTRFLLGVHLTLLGSLMVSNLTTATHKVQAVEDGQDTPKRPRRSRIVDRNVASAFLCRDMECTAKLDIETTQSERGAL